MQFKKIVATLAIFTIGASGGLVATGPAQGNGLVPIAKPAPVVEETRSAGTPPAVTASDKAHKSSTKEKSSRKGYPSAKGSVSTLTAASYNYVVVSDGLGAGETGNGFAANLPVENAFRNPADSHVLAQLAVDNSAGELIEYGITRDPNVFGDNQPRLFAGYRVNGVWQGYGTGFVDYAPNTTNTYGTAVTVVPGTQRRFEIKYSGGNWWLAYDLAWIGYIPGSLFTAPNTFVSGNLFQAFFEVAHYNAVVESCSDLGNGLPASNGSAARIGSVSISGLVPTTAVVAYNSYVQPAASLGYTITPLSATSFRGGGPGANAALTGVGTTGSC